LSGSFVPIETQGTRSKSGRMSVSLASPDGRVVGEGVAGLLVAASPMQVIAGSFLPSNQLELKPQKLKNGSGRPTEFMSLYPKGAENIKGLLKQNGKEKEEGMEQRLEEQGVIFAWFRKRKKEQKEDEVGQRSWDFIAGSELITADALISTGLAELGYVYLNIDDC
jgi:hypothetical protein